MRAAAYVRVSSADQIDGTSLGHQRESIAAYAKMRGIKLVTICQDNGVSGGMPISERPAGNKMVQAIDAGEIEAVLMLKIDRGFRNVIDCLSSIDSWAKSGVSVHFIDMGGMTVDSSSANGRFMLTILSGVAELERQTIKDRCNSGRKIKKAQGCLVGGTPFGYDVEPVSNKLLLNSQEQDVIAEITELHGAGMSYSAISRELNNRGYATKKGGKWFAQQVKNVLKAA